MSVCQSKIFVKKVMVMVMVIVMVMVMVMVMVVVTHGRKAYRKIFKSKEPFFGGF